MEYRYLGRSGLKVSAFSFGAMTFGDGSGQFGNIGDTRGKEADRQIGLCQDAGINLIDTADIYALGQSEVVLGEVLKGRSGELLIATKCLARMGKGPNDYASSRHHIIQACEASLKRLQRDHIDIYQIHNQDLATPPEEALRAIDDLVRAGKVRYAGSSNHSGWAKMRLLAASDRLGLTRYVSQQIRYSLLDRSADNELLPLGVTEGVGALIWGPLASGYLSGKFASKGDWSGTRLGARGTLDAMDSEHTRRVLAAVERIATGRGKSMSQVALGWVSRRAGVASIIIGARTTEQLTDNLGAVGWSLSDAEMAALDEASARPPIYPYDMHASFMGDRNPMQRWLPGVA